MKYSNDLDMRQCVTFGLLNMVIRRVHEYPHRIRLLLTPPEFKQYIDGTHCMDEIAVHFNLPRVSIMALIGDQAEMIYK